MSRKVVYTDEHNAARHVYQPCQEPGCTCPALVPDGYCAEHAHVVARGLVCPVCGSASFDGQLCNDCWGFYVRPPAKGNGHVG